MQQPKSRLQFCKSLYVCVSNVLCLCVCVNTDKDKNESDKRNIADHHNSQKDEWLLRTARTRTSTQPASQPVSQLKAIKPTKKFCANRETAVVLHGTVRVGLLLAGWLTLVVVLLLLLLPWVPCFVVIVAGVSLSFLRTFYAFVSTDLRWSMSGAAEQH